MRRNLLTLTMLGASMVGMLGCSAMAPPQSPVDVAAAQGRDLPLRADFRDATPELNSSAYEVQQRRGRRYRHRRIIVSGRPYFIPYFAYQNYYLPNYLRYDPYWYYVYAYSGPGFTGSRRLIRVRRDRDRDRRWTDRRDWDRDDRSDWRDRDRD